MIAASPRHDLRAPRARKLPLQIPPTRIAESYAAALIRSVVDPCRRAVAPLRAALTAARADSATARLDANDIKKLLAQAKTALGKAIDHSHLEKLARKHATQTAAYQKVQLDRQLVAGTGIAPHIRDKGLAKRVDGFVKDNVKLVKRIPERLHGDLEELVGDAADSGEVTSDLAKKIADRCDVEESHARLIANDQVLKLHADVNHARQQDLGIEKFRWRCCDDERVRGNPTGKYPDALPSHWELADKIYSYDDPPQPEGADEPILPGDDVCCFPGNTPVSSESRVQKLYRRRYRDETTVLRIDGGRVLTATPNHPVLTTRGWIAAHLVNVGDYLVQATDQRVDVPVSVVDDEHREPLIEEVFAALQPLGAAQVLQGSRHWFHGDMTDQEVDIVDVNRCLRLEGDLNLPQALCDEFLARTNDLAACRGGFDLLFDRSRPATDRVVRRGGQLLALLLGHDSHAVEHRSATIARLYAIADQLCADCRSIGAEVLRNALHTPPVGVEVAHHLARVVFSVVWGAVVNPLGTDAASAEELAQTVRVDTEGSRRLCQGTRPHQLLRVVEKCVGVNAGHVYNMQTESAWYVAQGAIVHNCRCWAEPYLDDILGDDEPDEDDEDEDD